MLELFEIHISIGIVGGVMDGKIPESSMVGFVLTYRFPGGHRSGIASRLLRR
jgi:hypothetical protein